MYRNPLLADRVRDCPSVDRYLQAPGMRLEQVLSLTIATDPTGIVHCLLSIDLVGPGHQASTGWPLAVYPLAQQMHAQEDALILARKWELTLRRADPNVGWQTVRDPDAEAEKRGADLVIGG